jgi:hypothetical protein
MIMWRPTEVASIFFSNYMPKKIKLMQIGCLELHYENTFGIFSNLIKKLDNNLLFHSIPRSTFLFYVFHKIYKNDFP